ncbi:MAG: hypothetical protein Q4B13_00105 [Lautropia sp.]|nr:hypothetical protein [Lautropia sp.]
MSFMAVIQANQVNWDQYEGMAFLMEILSLQVDLHTVEKFCFFVQAMQQAGR